MHATPANSPSAADTVATLSHAALLMRESKLSPELALQRALQTIPRATNLDHWSARWASAIGLARARNQQSFAEGGAPTFAESLKQVLAAEPRPATASSASGESDQDKPDVKLDKAARAHMARHVAAGYPIAYRVALQAVAAKPPDAEGDSQLRGAPAKEHQINESERLELLARAHQKRVFSERSIKVGEPGNTFGDALTAVSRGGFAELSPPSSRGSISVTPPGGQTAQTIARPWDWDRVAGWQLRAGITDGIRAQLLGQTAQPAETGTGYAEKTQHFAELKAKVLGRPVSTRPSLDQARAAARQSERLRMGDEPRQRVLHDNEDLVAAAESWITQRYRDRGQVVTFKEALKHISGVRR